MNTYTSKDKRKEEMYENIARLTVGRAPATVARKSQMMPLGKKKQK